jgi:hypothetical protein
VRSADLQARIDALDARFDEAAVAPTLDDLLRHGHGTFRRERTDALIGLMGAQLLELVADPALGATGRSTGRDAHPSGRRRRDGRRHECEACFDEGYVLGRILLDTHELALVHTPLAPVDHAEVRATTATLRSVGAIDEVRAAGFARLRALTRLVISEDTSRAFVATQRLAPFVRRRAEARSSAEASSAIDAALAAQLIGLGSMTALCEWSLLLGDDTPSAEILRLR